MIHCDALLRLQVGHLTEPWQGSLGIPRYRENAKKWSGGKVRSAASAPPRFREEVSPQRMGEFSSRLRAFARQNLLIPSLFQTHNNNLWCLCGRDGPPGRPVGCGPLTGDVRGRPGGSSLPLPLWVGFIPMGFMILTMVGRDRWARRVGFGGPSGPALPPIAEF